MTVPEFAAHMRQLEENACPTKEGIPQFNRLILEAGALGMNYREGLQHVIKRRHEIEKKASRIVH